MSIDRVATLPLEVPAPQRKQADELFTKRTVNALVERTGGVQSQGVSEAYVTATGSITARSLANWLSDAENVLAFGAAGDGATDDTTAIQAALAAGADIYFPPGTYITTGIVLASGNKRIRGAGMGKTTIKLKASADDIVIKADTLDDIIIEDLTIDGNKANQTATVEATGIKLIKSNRARIAHVEVKDCEGHGIHLNNQGATVTGQVLDHVLARDCGSGASNTYGSNIAITNGNGVILTACDSRGAAKAGFRLAGTGLVLNGCIAKDNGNGGLVPVSAESTDFTINGGEFSDNGPNENNDGIRLVGCDRFEINGVICTGNYGAGLHILNGCDNVTVNGGVFRNNGQHADAPDADEARSGIAITNSGTACSNIIIDGAKLLDDQGTPTQDYGVQIAGSNDAVVIDKCVFSGNQTGPLDYSTSANGVRIGNLNVGLALPYQDNSDVALTGTTSTTDLFTRSISANEFGRRGVLRGRFAATCAGGAGTKTFSLVFGSSTVTAVVTASGSTDDVVITWEAYALSTSSLRAFVTATVGAASYNANYDVPTPTMSSAWNMKVTGKLSDAADTITGKMFALERVR